MSNEEKEKMLDLLCDKFVFGLSAEDERQLDKLGYDRREAESIELTAVTLGLAGVEPDAAMPAHLQARLLASAEDFFDGRENSGVVPAREIVASESPSNPWFGWLGWATAAAASIALAVALFVPRGVDNRAEISSPTPSSEERLSPEQQRQRLLESSPGQTIVAEWSPGKMPDVTVSGDVVWNAAKQAGYLRVKGLPKNDVAKETYQLWIVDGSQDPKTPIDGGTFDINTEGEVIIPINAKLKAIDPKAFAITVEKPGGVVVSKQGKLAALAPVKPKQA